MRVPCGKAKKSFATDGWQLNSFTEEEKDVVLCITAWAKRHQPVSYAIVHDRCLCCVNDTTQPNPYKGKKAIAFEELQEIVKDLLEQGYSKEMIKGAQENVRMAKMTMNLPIIRYK